MKAHTQEMGIGDRIATRQELGEVIVQLVKLHELPFEATLESLESSENLTQEDDLELWTDSDRDRLREAEIESLTQIILGRRQRLD
jgi:hypothetical protein